MKKTISFLLNALLVSAGITMLSACIESEDKYTTTLVIYDERGDRMELAKYKQVLNCQRSAMLWRENVPVADYTGTFACEVEK